MAAFQAPLPGRFWAPPDTFENYCSQRQHSCFSPRSAVLCLPKTRPPGCPAAMRLPTSSSFSSTTWAGAIFPASATPRWKRRISTGWPARECDSSSSTSPRPSVRPRGRPFPRANILSAGGSRRIWPNVETTKSGGWRSGWTRRPPCWPARSRRPATPRATSASGTWAANATWARRP